MNDIFTFEGRIGRGRFWYRMVLQVFFAACLSVLIVVASEHIPRGWEILAGVAVFLVFIPLITFGLSTLFRRLHDRNRSGWWLFLYWLAPGALSVFGERFENELALLASLAISLVGIIDIGIMPGTRGENRFGRKRTEQRAIDALEVVK